MEIRVLKVFHTADIHGSLTREKQRRIQDLLSEARAEELTSTILLDSGDALASSSTLWLPWEPTISRMNELRYLAGAVGNREFHYLYPLFLLRRKAFEFDLLSANLLTPKGSPLNEGLLDEIDGIRLLITGLTPVQYDDASLWRRVFGWSFVDPLEALDRVVKRYKGKYDLLIVLSHLGIDEDIRLAEVLPEGSVVLGGHSHVEVSENRNGILIGHPGAYLNKIGVAELIMKSDSDRQYKLIKGEYQILGLG